MDHGVDYDDAHWDLRRRKQELVLALSERTGIDGHCFNAHAKHVHGGGRGVDEMSLEQLAAAVDDLERWWGVIEGFDGHLTPALFARLAAARVRT